MKGSAMASSRQSTRATTTKSIGAGAEIQNYQLAERIGQDELGLIYRARHQVLDRDVHIHVLRRSGWIAVSRFQLAAKLAARVQHPCILPVLDAGHDDRYGYYMVTPPVAAQPLQTLLDAGPLDPPRAMRIFAQVGQALDELHRHQIIHRDVQPQTILITSDGKAYLTGFSLAWAPDGPDLSQLDEADYLTSYAAPEQTFNDRTPDPALDIYALGAVLYHMLTGEAPPGVGVEPAALAEQDPRFAPADRILRRMLAPEPHLRYPSAAQAAAALRAALHTIADTNAAVPADADMGGQWLDNPLEIVLRDRLDDGFLARTHQRADELHSGEGVRHLLDLWSNNNPVRRQQLGQLIRIDQIVSYNVYFYDLIVLYETRTHPEQRERPLTGSSTISREPAPDHWDIEVPVPEEPFADVSSVEIAIPHSEQIATCPHCKGTTYLTCPHCHGRGTIDIKHTVRTQTGSHIEIQTIDCAECQGQARLICERCDGEGRLLTNAVFRFSRRGRLWQNTDDIEGLPQRTLETGSEPVFVGEIDLHDPVWHAVQPLHELISEATKSTNDETRIVANELTIRGTPVTEVDYTFRDKPHTLAITGFDSDIRGDFSLFDTERLLIVLLVIALSIVIAIAVSLYFGLLGT
jgi:tRNA A-37 threonylcarbamoyl transferase component Bud32